MLYKSVTVLVECHSSVLMLKGMKKKRIAVRGHSDAQLRRVSRLPSANRRRRRRRRNHKRHLVKISALAICNERNHRGLAKDKRTRFGRMRTVLPPLTQIDKSRNSQKEMLYCTALHCSINVTPSLRLRQTHLRVTVDTVVGANYYYHYVRTHLDTVVDRRVFWGESRK